MAKSVNYFSTHGWLIGLVLAPFGVPDLGTLGCKKDAGAPTVDADAVTNVKLANSATLGSFLTDSVENTLYFFARDMAGASTCASAACNSMWPVYYNATLKAPKALKAEDFATKPTTDGRLQTTYKGWPLYYFAPPASGVCTRGSVGQTNGNGVGGIWHVVNPAYGVVLASKSVEDQTTHVVVNKTFLVDAQGRTLYYFAKDNSNLTAQPTNCTGGCASTWPALYLSAPAVPSTLESSDSVPSPATPALPRGPMALPLVRTSS